MAKVAKVANPLLTSTVYPEENQTRKEVWENSGECIHRWAANRHIYGRTGSSNVYFDRGVIYGYGRHFPMARWVKLRGGRVVVFFNDRRYSATTSKHQSEVRGAIPNDVTVFRVENVLADSKADHEKNLKAFGVEALARVKEATAPRRTAGRRGQLLSSARITTQLGNAYAAAVGLRTRLPEVVTGDEISAWAAKVAAKERAAKKKAADAQRKLEAERMAKWLAKIEEWKAGGEWPGDCPDPSWDQTYLRVKGNVLETSMRAAVPVKAVMPILAAVRDPAVKLPENFGVDKFRLRSVDHDTRLVIVGCHQVTFEEVERIAKVLGL